MSPLADTLDQIADNLTKLANECRLAGAFGERERQRLLTEAEFLRRSVGIFNLRGNEPTAEEILAPILRAA